jgi:predicted porin
MSATGIAAQCGATAAWATAPNPSGATPAVPNYYAVGGNSAAVGTGSTSVTCAAANYGGDVTGYLAGIKYKVTPALQLGLGWAHGEGDNTNYITGVNDINKAGTAAQVAAGTKAVAATGATLYNSNVVMLGASYQVTPAVAVGGSYMVTTADSSQYNFQTRYALSKRTTAYFQANMAKNGAGANSLGTAYGNFLVMGGQTGTSPSVQVQGMAALPNTTQASYGVGIIHSF